MAPFFFGSGGNSVLVNTTKDQYNPGECIQGFAHVNIITATDFSGLFLKVSGKERLRFDDYETYYVPHVDSYYSNGKWYTRQRRRAARRRVDRFGKHTLFKTEIMLLAGGQLVPGQYTVPFNYVLPHGLPGSFSLVESDFDCGIEYSVKALVRVPGIFKSNLRSIRSFEVTQESPANIQSISASANSTIDVCCFFNQGHAQLSFRCVRNAFYCGESVGLVASAINNSTADLKRLTVKLRRYIQLRADTGHSKRCEYTISEGIYPGVPANTSSHEIPMSLYIPIDAPQQCFGARIRCLYSVRLSGKVECGNDATCTVPAFIFRPKLATAFVLPSDPSWNPLVLDPVEIVSSAPAAIPEPITLSQYPDCETMHPSAPTEIHNFIHSPQPVVSSSQQALDGAFMRK